jgi:glutamine amidotransferase
MIAIINYGVGNLTSVHNMFRRIGADAVITGDPELIIKAEKLLLPGVGHFDSCIQNFYKSGLRDAVEHKIFFEKRPILGICVGAQMMTRGSEEGKEKGFAWVDADTIRFKLDKQSKLKIPNMGWNDLIITKYCPLWNDIGDEARFYFAHSYHFNFDNEEYVTGKARYGYEYPVAYQIDNIYATQFHPEKSHRFGMKVLENFAQLSQ